VDGELSAPEWDALLQGGLKDPAWMSDWQSYHLVGEVLRGGARTATASPAPQDFLAAFNARLRAESVVQPATVAVVDHRLRPAAANQPVFLWKMVAGLASVVAVVAVSWSLVAAVDAPSQGGAQLARATAPEAPAAPVALMVQTPQGQVLRDARLEALLAEHRQYGGMSALQMPAGFLRNATYDAAPGR
jgi:sigma-E factor negative regulatory protein RseA